MIKTISSSLELLYAIEKIGSQGMGMGMGLDQSSQKWRNKIREMNMSGKAIILVIVLFSLMGCANMDIRSRQSGHPYIGLRYSSYTIKCGLVNASNGSYPYLRVPIIAITSLLFAVIEIPLDGVVDTIYLPKDLQDEPTNLEIDMPEDCGFMSYSTPSA